MGLFGKTWTTSILSQPHNLYHSESVCDQLTKSDVLSRSQLIRSEFNFTYDSSPFRLHPPQSNFLWTFGHDCSIIWPSVIIFLYTRLIIVILRWRWEIATYRYDILRSLLFDLVFFLCYVNQRESPIGPFVVCVYQYITINYIISITDIIVLVKVFYYQKEHIVKIIEALKQWEGYP